MSDEEDNGIVIDIDDAEEEEGEVKWYFFNFIGNGLWFKWFS